MFFPWADEDFIQTIRTGVSPHGHELASDFMPREPFAKFFDDALRGLWISLQSLPPIQTEEP